jgi:hypothetical protein
MATLKKPRSLGKTVRDIFNWWVPVERIPVAAVSSSALEASKILVARPAALVSLSGHTTAAGFVQLFDSATLPADGAVPVIAIKVGANTDFLIERAAPVAFAAGIVAVFSSTLDTKTISSASCLFAAQVTE